MPMTEFEWMHIFAGNLKSLLKENHMTQQDLADATGISKATISKYLNAQCMPSLNALINIAHEFPCAELSDLLYFDDRIEFRPSRR